MSDAEVGNNLSKLVQQLEKIEFKTDRDLYNYARILRAIGLELHMRIGMDADVIGAILSQYKGKWYAFGTDSKVRGKLVGAQLRAGSTAAKVMGLAGVKMYASFVRHFIKPEAEAESKAAKGKKQGFAIGDKPAGSAGRPGEGGRAA